MKRTFDIRPSPGEMAAEFCDWTDIEQAEFFENCARIFEGFGAAHRDQQLLGLTRAIAKWPAATEWWRSMADERLARGDDVEVLAP